MRGVLFFVVVASAAAQPALDPNQGVSGFSSNGDTQLNNYMRLALDGTPDSAAHWRSTGRYYSACLRSAHSRTRCWL